MREDYCSCVTEGEKKQNITLPFAELISVITCTIKACSSSGGLTQRHFC